MQLRLNVSVVSRLNILPTKVSSSNSNQIRSNFIVYEIDQLSWENSLVFGKLKHVKTTRNSNELGKGLLRLATLNESAFSKSVLHALMGFQIHGDLFMYS